MELGDFTQELVCEVSVVFVTKERRLLYIAFTKRSGQVQARPRPEGHKARPRPAGHNTRPRPGGHDIRDDRTVVLTNSTAHRIVLPY